MRRVHKISIAARERYHCTVPRSPLAMLDESGVDIQGIATLYSMYQMASWLSDIAKVRRP